MGSYKWTRVINADSQPTDPDSIRISNDIYWSLAQALSDDHSSSIKDDYCYFTPNGDCNGYTAWHALVKSIKTKDQNVIMDVDFSQQLRNMKINHKDVISHYINHSNQTVELLQKADKIFSVSTKLKGCSLNLLLM